MVPAARLIEAREDVAPAFVTESSCCEFLRATTHPKTAVLGWSLPQAWRFISALFEWGLYR